MVLETNSTMAFVETFLFLLVRQLISSILFGK